jgi:hypothetical protein
LGLAVLSSRRKTPCSQKQSQVVTCAPDAERAVRTWQALTPKQKADYLDGLMREAASQAVPRLLAN